MNRIALATALAVCLAATPGATAQGPPAPAAPVTSEAEAVAELAEAEQALTADDPQAAEVTAELRDLVLALPYLDGDERRRARAMLARPPMGDGATEPFEAEWTAPESPLSPLCDANFCVHWVNAPNADAPPNTDLPDFPNNAIPDYVELVAEKAAFSQNVENGTLGWPDPKSDGTEGGGSGLTDIYLSDLCSPSICLFGYASPDDNSAACRRPPFRCAAYLVLDNDYAQAEFGYADPTVPLEVTMAHEYNHVLQFNLDTIQDVWMFESTATWMEEEVFPDANDWLVTYMPSWARGSSIPITRPTARRIYGSAVWNHWLDQGAAYGPDVVLDSWQRSRQSRPKDYAVGAYHLGIRANGGSGFAQEFARFAAATAEWRVADGNFPDEAALPDVQRAGVLRPRHPSRRFELDHTAYRLLHVKPGGRGVARVRVWVRRGIRTGIALVGRDGSPLGGAITQALKYLPRGGRATVKLRRAGRFERITAVVANADGRVRGFAGSDWNYTRDNERYRVVLGAR